MVHDSYLQPAHHHRANGRIHRLINVETRLVPETPDLKWKKTGIRNALCFVWFKWESALGQTLYSWMMPFWWSGGGGSQEMLMEVLFWFPTVRTVTCWGGALGAERGGVSMSTVKYTTHQSAETRNKHQTDDAHKNKCTHSHAFVTMILCKDDPGD